MIILLIDCVLFENQLLSLTWEKPTPAHGHDRFGKMTVFLYLSLFYLVLCRQWAVEFLSDENVNLESLAEAHDVVYDGPVSQALKNVHLFSSPSKTFPAPFANYLYTKGGHNKPSIVASYEQIPKEFQGRGFIVSGEEPEIAATNKPENREKRDFVVRDPSYPIQWHLHQYSNYHENSHVNAPGAWNLGFLGTNVTIGFVDDGIEYTHPDLHANFHGELSYNFRYKNNNWGPENNWNVQGTALAGLASGRDDGLACGVGVAPRSKIASLVLLQGRTEFTDAEEAAALSYQNNKIDIYNNGWGPNAPGWNGQVNRGPGPLTEAAINASIHHGRNGLGNIYVWAGGNDGNVGDSCNYDGYVNDRYTILVGATGSSGTEVSYSEMCDAVMVVAPGAVRGNGIVTTDLSGRRGFNPNANCTTIANGIAGTSPAATIVSGVVALMLQANPKLTWLDVQYCLVASATKIDPIDELWEQNGVGRWYNPKFGFGMVNALGAVQEALNRRNSHVRERQITFTSSSPVGFHNEGGLLKAKISWECREFVQIHHVELQIWTDHTRISGNTIAIASPAGTLSVLASPHNDNNSRWQGWTFLSNKFWGEKSYGSWDFIMADNNLNQADRKITKVIINVFGDGQ